MEVIVVGHFPGIHHFKTDTGEVLSSKVYHALIYVNARYRTTRFRNGRRQLTCAAADIQNLLILRGLEHRQ